MIKSTADDTVITTAFGEGWPDAPHRVLMNSIERLRMPRWVDACLTDLVSPQPSTAQVTGCGAVPALWATLAVGKLGCWPGEPRPKLGLADCVSETFKTHRS